MTVSNIASNHLIHNFKKKVFLPMHQNNFFSLQHLSALFSVNIDFLSFIDLCLQLALLWHQVSIHITHLAAHVLFQTNLSLYSPPLTKPSYINSVPWHILHKYTACHELAHCIVLNTSCNFAQVQLLVDTYVKHFSTNVLFHDILLKCNF